MKKIVWVLVFGMLLSLFRVNAINCTMNVPHAGVYDNGSLNIKFNVTANWEGSGQNATNVSVTFGSVVFTNTTVNGTLPKADGEGTAGKGDFTFTIDSSLLSAGSLTTYATCYNSTSALDGNSAKNSSSITYNVDTTSPVVLLTNPISGSTVIPSSNSITFEYTPTDSNFGNCSLHINNVNVKSSTSATATPNVTSGAVNRFTNVFGADNNSVRAVVQCRDLAGRESPSNNLTFNVLLGALSPAQKQAIASGGGFHITSQPQSANGYYSPPSVQYSTHLQQWGWAYFIAVVLIAGLAIRKFWK